MRHNKAPTAKNRRANGRDRFPAACTRISTTPTDEKNRPGRKTATPTRKKIASIPFSNTPMHQKNLRTRSKVCFDERVRPLDEDLRPFDERMRPLDEGLRVFDERVRALDDLVQPFDKRVRVFDDRMRVFDGRVRVLDDRV